ncbi:hypothetical protein [Nocardia sp. NPDC003963]
MIEQTGRSPSAPDGSLPEPDHLYRAIAGHIVGGSPVFSWARELGDLHAELLPVRFRGTRDPGEERIRSDIRLVADAIDLWTTRHIAAPAGARLHTHPLGAVISHNAEVYARAQRTALHSADERIRYTACNRLAEARQGYTEMIEEVQRRRLRFPAITAPQYTSI